MCWHASTVNAGSASMRVYSVGTPMNTVACGSQRMAVLGSNLFSHNSLLPLINAPCRATNRPWT